jgi:hypothetical protein
MDWSGSIVEKTLENREVGTALRVSFGVSRPDGIFGKDNPALRPLLDQAAD